MARSFTPAEFVAHLARAAAQISTESVAIVQRGALNIKAEGRRNSAVSSGMSAAAAPNAIGFDRVHINGLEFSAEVGYEARGGQSALGVLLEFGGGRDHSPPHNDLGRALDAEEPGFVQALTVAAVQALA